jgi:hypothetical protein
MNPKNPIRWLIAVIRDARRLQQLELSYPQGEKQ